MSAVSKLIAHRLSDVDTVLRGCLKEERWVTVREAAEALEIHEDTIRRWIDQDSIVHGYEGGRVVVDWPKLLDRTEYKRKLRKEYWVR